MERKWYSWKEIKDKKQQCYDDVNLCIDYIENFKQQQKAKENNKKLIETAEFCTFVLNQMTDIENDFKDRRIIIEIEYSKGYFKIIRGKDISYMKLDKTQWELQRSH